MDSTRTLAIIEFKYHWDYFITQVQVLEKIGRVVLVVGREFANSLEKNYGFDFSAYETLILDTIDWPRVNQFLQDQNVDKAFLPTIQGMDLVEGVARNAFPCGFYVTIHNFDLWFGKRPAVAPGSHPQADKINAMFLQACKNIMQRCDGLVTIDPSIQGLLSRVITGKPLLEFPWCVNTHPEATGDGPAGDGDEVIFTVNGGISCNRRNYGAVLESFKQILAKHTKVRLVLLGRAADQSGLPVLQVARAINEQLGREAIVVFDEFVDSSVYANWIRRSDFLIQPLVNLHIYGLYKSSAALLEAIRYGVPVLVPRQMKFHGEFGEQFGDGILVYEDLGETIDELLQAPRDQLELLTLNAQRNAEYYHLDHQVDRIQNTFFTDAA